jgi:hypothetical protein
MKRRAVSGGPGTGPGADGGRADQSNRSGMGLSQINILILFALCLAILTFAAASIVLV